MKFIYYLKRQETKVKLTTLEHTSIQSFVSSRRLAPITRNDYFWLNLEQSKPSFNTEIRLQSVFLTRRSFIDRQYPPRIATKIRVEWLLEKPRCISMLDVWDFIFLVLYLLVCQYPRIRTFFLETSCGYEDDDIERYRALQKKVCRSEHRLPSSVCVADLCWQTCEYDI